VCVCVCLRGREHCDPHRADRSGDRGGDTLPGPVFPPLDPQTAANSNAARIVFPEEHPTEAPRPLALLGPRAPGEKSSTAQLLYSSTRSLVAASTRVCRVTRNMSFKWDYRKQRNFLEQWLKYVTYNMVVPSKQMSVRVLSTITRSVSWISVPL